MSGKQGDFTDSALVGARQRWPAMIQIVIQLCPPRANSAKACTGVGGGTSARTPVSERDGTHSERPRETNPKNCFLPQNFLTPELRIVAVSIGSREYR